MKIERHTVKKDQSTTTFTSVSDEQIIELANAYDVGLISSESNTAIYTNCDDTIIIKHNVNTGRTTLTVGHGGY